ncbi:MAG: hypothetical protein AB1442_12820, partial [Nitrospirota bacterium]
METIDAVSILYEIHRNTPNPMGGDNFLDPDNFFPLGLKLYRDVEELHIECVPAGKVRALDSFTHET